MQVAAECNTAGGEAIAVRADVTADADCRRLRRRRSAWGRLDALGTTREPQVRATRQPR